MLGFHPISGAPLDSAGLSIASGAGAATGSSTAAGVGRSTTAGAGTATGSSTAAGVGAVNGKAKPGKGGGGSGGGTNVLTTTTSPTTTVSGSTFLVVVTDASSAPTVTDSKGNTYTQVFRQGNAANNVALYYCADGVGGANHTATVTYSAAASPGVCFVELTGVATVNPLDVSTSTNDNNSPYTTTTPLTHQDVEIVVSVIGTDSTNNPVAYAIDNGFDILEVADNGSAYWTGAIAAKVVYTEGTYTANWTAPGATKSVVGTAAFKAAAFQAVGAASGSSTVLGTGAALAVGAGSASGSSTAVGAGGTVIQGAGAASGSSTALGAGGYAVVSASGAGASSGSSTAVGVGQALAVGAGASLGGSTAAGVGAALAEGAGSASGVSSTSGYGQGLLQGVGEAFGSSTTAGVGQSFRKLMAQLQLFARSQRAELHGRTKPFQITVNDRDTPQVSAVEEE